MLALAGTGLLVLAARQTRPLAAEISEIGVEDVGKLVEVRGALASVSQRDGNFFLKICSNACITAVVFKGLAREMAENSLDLSLLEKGQGVAATGVVKEYGDGIEIVPFDRNAIELGG